MIQLLQKYKFQKARSSNGQRLLSDTSGTKLAQGLGIDTTTPSRILKTRHSNLPELLINWGTTDTLPHTPDQQFLNKPDCVRVSSNKLSCFNAISSYYSGTSKINIVPHYVNLIEYARLFLQNNPTEKIFCRTLLNSSSGKGIVVARTPEELVDAPLYTVYFPKKWEIRVHVAFGRVIDITQKRRLSTEELESRGIDNREKLIRNLANGYIFSRDLDSGLGGIISEIESDSVEVVRDALGLDFGALDIVINEDLEWKLLEVNSAPGLEGTTLNCYINSFKDELGIGVI